MARDHIPHPDRHDLARAAEKGFYPVKIPVSHWQLRHYISNPEQDLLYYASGHDVYCLNVATKKRRHIATLPFEARCTASGYGWVCVGGEDEGQGRFAVIKLDGSGSRAVDADVALPIEHWGQNLVRRAPRVKVERIGEEIVNSISIHRISDEEAHLDDIVAVLTNNDRTVRVYSLPLGQETRVKELPFAMNHATISPDGTMMVAVGDVNQACFFMRDIKDRPPQIPKPHNRLNSSSVEWSLTSIITLHVSGPEATTGYFTTAWSPNGQLVAVGSEGGYITVFDMEILLNPDLDDDEAVMAVVPGSRADEASPHPGAIRSMTFSPEPWDLLIWAEDQGRVCIGDLRLGLKSRQVISLEPKAAGLTMLDFEDVPRDDYGPAAVASVDDLETEWLRRYRSTDGQAEVNFATEYIEARRRQRRQRELASSRSTTNASGARPAQAGLSEDEHAILETLRTSRQREEARTSGGLPRSVNYTTPDLFNDASGRPSTSSTPDSTSGGARPINEILNSVQESLPELSRMQAVVGRTVPAQAANAVSRPPSAPDSPPNWSQSLQSSSSMSRGGDASRLPRRRQSVVLRPPQTSSSTAQAGLASAVRSGETETVDETDWRYAGERPTRGPLFESAARARASSPLPAADGRRDLQDLQDLQAELLETEMQTQRRLLAARGARERWRREALRAVVPSGEAASGRASASISTSAELGTTFTANTAAALLDMASHTVGLDAGRPSGMGVAMAEARLTRAEYDLMRRPQMHGSRHDIGVRTAGLAMSPDGRTLWAACEEGIFEVPIAVKQRLGWPAVEMR